MIEVVDPATKNWVPAIVKIVKKEEITAEYKNVPGTQITDNWPSPKMRYSPPRLQSTKATEFKAQVCFTPKDSCPTGFQVDNGKMYGPNSDFEFGWSKDMQSMTRLRNSNPDPLLANSILFPPHPKSKWCIK